MHTHNIHDQVLAYYVAIIFKLDNHFKKTHEYKLRDLSHKYGAPKCSKLNK